MDLEKNIKVLLVMGMEQELAEGYVKTISTYSSWRAYHFKKQ